MYSIRYNLPAIIIWLGVLTVFLAIFSEVFTMDLVAPLVALAAFWIIVFALTLFVRADTPPTGPPAHRPDRANPPGSPS